jgi:pantoate--beta-alanine ligase
MRTIVDIAEMQAAAEVARREGKRISVVPTMGSLHAGHLSLMALARQRSEVLVTTLFVNPLQFGPAEDYERYPRNLQHDRELALQAGTDILFTPQVRQMYPESFKSIVEIQDVSSVLEGVHRPGHFTGVTTVVLKLFNITKPHIAVFGQKDAQQAFLIRKMVVDLNLDLEVVIAPIIREKDGLALSSRNVYLSPDERARATSLYRALCFATERIEAGERSVELLRKGMSSILSDARPTQVDYVAFVRPGDFGELRIIEPPTVLIALAVRFGSTRLIDNMLVSV